MIRSLLLRPLYILRQFVLMVMHYRSIGARALVVKDDEVLLVRHTYLTGWYTIGGTVERKETFLEAVMRELKEEVGVTPTIQPTLHGVYFNTYFGRDDYIAFYIVRDPKIEEVNSPEIAEKKWFKFTALPEDISPATKRRVEEYLGQRAQSEKW